MNLLDRALAYVSPSLGAARAASRMRIGATSGYQAAKRELAAMRNMASRAQTADADTLPNLDTIRARSRDLIMNAPLAGGAISTMVTNVVGVGLRMSPQADGRALAALAGITAEQVKAFEAGAEREWKLFCRAEHCDATRRLSFAGMQELAFRSVLASGDCFLPVVATPRGRPFDFALQLVEADRISNPMFSPSSQTLADGVEYDAAGAVAAYHIAEQDRTTSVKRSWRRFDAWAPDGSPRVLHLMAHERIGQSRGVPFLAPVMAAMKDLDRYTQAEITAAVLNACIAILGESTTGDSPLKAEASASGTAATQDGLQRADINFEPGMVLEGFMKGETIRSFDAARPNQGFDPFVQAVLRQVGVRLGLPFEVLVMHFTASYSAARAALLQAWAFFRMRRAWLAASLCQPAYELVIANAVMRGRLAAPGLLADPMLRAAWCAARWTGPSPGQIDPLKEVKAAELRLGLMLSTRTRETAELTGDDWEQVAEEAAEEWALLESLGLPTSADVPAPAPAMPEDGADPDAEEPAEPADIGDSDKEAA
jgi:lambda family phage portal protein